MITRKRAMAWAVALVLFAGLVICGGVLFFSGPREPSFQGKSLSAWIVPFAKQSPSGVMTPGGPPALQSLESVRHAVRQMVTNAVPFLVARMNARERLWHRKLRELAQKQRATASLLDDPAVGQIRAIRSLAVLGTNATEAIPGLINHLTNNLTSSHAIYALTSMGTQGFQALLNQTTNRNPAIRSRLRIELMMRPPIAFGIQSTNDPSHQFYLSALVRYAQDPEPSYRMMALGRLVAAGLGRGLTTNELNLVVPVLLSSLGDSNAGIRLAAMNALSNIRPPAEMVVGTLTNYLTNSDMSLRMGAAAALRRYGYSPEPVFFSAPRPPISPGMAPPPVPPRWPRPPNFPPPYAPYGGQTSPPSRFPSDPVPRTLPPRATNSPATNPVSSGASFLPEELYK